MNVYEIVVDGDGESWERLLAEQEATAAEGAIGASEVGLREHAEEEEHRHAGGARHVAFVPLRLARAILAAVEADGGLRLERVREVTGAHFDVSVEAFAEPAARAIRAVLGDAPPGVEMIRYRDEEEEERDHPDGTGPAGFTLNSPLHCDAYRVRWRVEGALPGVLGMRRLLRSLPYVHEGPIELAARLVDPAVLVEGQGGGR